MENFNSYKTLGVKMWNYIHCDLCKSSQKLGSDHWAPVVAVTSCAAVWLHVGMEFGVEMSMSWRYRLSFVAGDRPAYPQSWDRDCSRSGYPTAFAQSSRNSGLGLFLSKLSDYILVQLVLIRLYLPVYFCIWCSIFRGWTLSVCWSETEALEIESYYF